VTDVRLNIIYVVTFAAAVGIARVCPYTRMYICTDDIRYPVNGIIQCAYSHSSTYTDARTPTTGWGRRTCIIIYNSVIVGLRL